MKRKLNILVILLVLASVVTMQSCKKQAPLEPVGYVAAMPTTPSPVVSAVIPFTGSGQAVNLSWAGTASATAKWTVYFGTSSHPAQVATNVTTNTYTAHIGTKGGVYYWMVETTDPMEVYTASPVWKFDVNSNPGATTLSVPAASATGVGVTSTLKWKKTVDPEGDALTYDLYLGTATTPPSLVTGLTDTTYTIATALTNSTVYYWKVVTKDPYGGSSTSAINSFTTGAFVPDYTVFNGIYSEVCPSFSATTKKDVFLSINTTTHVITMYLPLADGMAAAGWGTIYTGAHPITITYDPVTFAITSTKQLWTDSYVDPVEMGPMSLKVSTGTIDAPNKKLSIKWIISGNAYWGADYTTGTTTYTFRINK